MRRKSKPTNHVLTYRELPFVVSQIAPEVDKSNSKYSFKKYEEKQIRKKKIQS